MTGLEKIITQIIDDAKANAQKAKAAAEEEASKILASAKTQREEQVAQIPGGHAGAGSGNRRSCAVWCQAQTAANAVVRKTAADP